MKNDELWSKKACARAAKMPRMPDKAREATCAEKTPFETWKKCREVKTGSAANSFWFEFYSVHAYEMSARMLQKFNAS